MARLNTRLAALRSRLSVMGILNITPDSFSDGGQFANLDSVLQRAEQMVVDGVDILDIGGESTRPGAQTVSAELELERVMPVLTALRERFDVVISVDTRKAEVMREVIRAGADMINDVCALQEAGALAACAEAEVGICLMHMQGQPSTMQQNPVYTDVVADLLAFFQQRLLACEQAGIGQERLWLDPGFGFGKTLAHNVELLRRLPAFDAMQLPLLVGISRKATIGALLGDKPVEQRLQGSVAAAVIAAMNGARIVRVHDVRETVEAMQIVRAVLNEPHSAK